MSSRKPVSTARPQTFWSIEYGDFLVVVDRQALLLGEGDGLVAGHAGVTDRREHLEVRAERADADLEAHLVVALAGAAVGDHRWRRGTSRRATRCLTISGRDSAETSG